MEWSRDENILFARRLPGRLTAREVEVLTGFLAHEISILWRKGFLDSALLSDAACNGHKAYGRDEILRLCSDHKWLSKCQKAIQKAWQDKNARQEAEA
jgi:hypothetical protein